MNTLEGLQSNKILITKSFKKLDRILYFSAAVSFMVAEQFGEAVNMQAITRAASLGRSAGRCNGQLGVNGPTRKRSYVSTF